MILWLASYPRSGNTFFRILLHHCANITTFSEYNDPDIVNLGASDIVGHKLLPAPLKRLAASSETFFVKTHELPRDNSPTIYLVRDGRDTVVSYAKYILAFGPQGIRGYIRRWPYHTYEETLEDVISARDRFGGWSDHVQAWLNREGSLTAIIRYEDLVVQPHYWLEKALETVGTGCARESMQRVPSFAELHRCWPNFFRQGQVGGWKQDMPERLHTLFWRNHGHVMSELSYEK